MSGGPEAAAKDSPVGAPAASSWLDHPGRLEAIVVAAALVTFLPSLAAGYVFDDLPLIVDNPYAHDWSFLGRCFRTDLWDTPARLTPTASVRFYRPVVTASYVATWVAGGGAAWAFHLGNVVVHAAAAWLAVRVARRWTGAAWPALLVALVFAVHPSRTENVVWISGRTDVWMGAFLLGALELAVAAAAARGAARWLAAGGLWVLAVLSKEYAVCLPLLLLVEAALADVRGDGAAPRRLRTAAVATGAVVVAYFAARAAWMPLRPPEASEAAPPLSLHAAWVLLTAGYYAERLLLPWPQTFHYRPIAYEGGGPVLPAASVALGALVLVALAAGVAAGWRRDRVRTWMFAAALAAVLPIVHVVYAGFDSPTADRFLYFPSFVVACAIARALAGPIERWRRGSRLAGLVVGSVALACAGVVWVRTLDYQDEEAMWSRELEVNPANPRALARLAQEREARGEVHEAFSLMNRAMAPEARRLDLLAQPTRVYLAQLELQGRRLADGDALALAALLEEQVALVERRPPGALRRSADLDLERPSEPHFWAYVENARYHLAPAAALVASRLGRDDEARRMAAAVPDAALVDPRARFNLALALARGGAWGPASRQLELGGAAPSVAAAAAELRGRLGGAERAVALAAGEPEPARSVALARVDLELGAYLRAARRLRPHAARLDPAGRLLFGEALLFARRAEARAALAPEDYARLEAGLSELGRRALEPDPGAEW
ncbi:MAG: glycosyltransferase family 39 protein [Polyangiaceae bacterium]|nr:glycosyltransferase family 39 protein [Polyangiaceae bacterium]